MTRTSRWRCWATVGEGGAAPVVAETLKVGGKSAGHLWPHGHDPNIALALLLAAWVFAIAYGVFFFKRGPSPLRTFTKTAAVAALAVWSWWEGAPLLLTAALGLCALGDAFLAGDPKRWLPFGLASFLLGHLVYLALFVVVVRDSLRPPALVWMDSQVVLNWPRIACMLGAVLAAGVMLRWLWSSLGRLQLAVTAYVAAIVAMVCASLTLPPYFASATMGAIAFFASDAVLSAQLFKQRFEGRAGQWAVWGLYFVGQVWIASAFFDRF